MSIESIPEPQVRELVDGSGLTPATIEEAGLYFEHDRDRLASLLNRRAFPKECLGGLVFPYLDDDGTPRFHRVKPTRPLKSTSGSSAKYLSPVGGGVRPYVPPAARQAVSAAVGRLFLTEGEKKSLCLTQNGFHTIGLSGVDCWHPPRSTALLPDLARITWRGREVFIVFDSDATSNRGVRDNESLLAAALERHGARVKIVRLPPAADGGKQGADDFLVAHGAAEFEKLVAKAEDPNPPEAIEMLPASKLDAALEAERILEDTTHDGVVKLRTWRGAVWFWSAGAYRERADEEVRSEIANQLASRWHQVRRAHVTDVELFVRAKTQLSSRRDPPTWLGEPPHDWRAVDCVSFKNGILNLPAFMSGAEVSFVPPTPALFTVASCDYDFDPGAPQPERWFGFLDELWHDDPESVAALQEMFGYLVTADTSLQKIFLLVGPPRGGKGTIARVLTGLVGAENVVAPTMTSLAGNFGLQQLVGRSIATVTDARLGRQAEATTVLERLLTISGEDAVAVDRKFRDGLTCKLPTRFLIATNDVPNFVDASGALAARLVAIRTTRSFVGREDTALTAKLFEERAGILLWALAGWHRLQAQGGRFTQPESGQELVDELRSGASPVVEFADACLEFAPDSFAAIDELFGAWQAWCERSGRGKFAGTANRLSRDLMSAFPEIHRTRPRQSGARVRGFTGVRVRPEF